MKVQQFAERKVSILTLNEKSQANLANQFDGEQQCRICLEGETIGNQLITPCKCAGSVRYVHFNCMKQWIMRHLQKGKRVILCEMCKQIIICTLKRSNKRANCQQFQIKVAQNLRYFIFVIFLITLALGLKIYLIVLFAVTVSKQQQHISWLQMGLLLFSIVFLLVFIVIFSSVLVRNYIIVDTTDIVHIKNKDNPNYATTFTSNNTLASSKQISGNKPCHGKVYPLIIQQIQ